MKRKIAVVVAFMGFAALAGVEKIGNIQAAVR